MRYGFWTSLLCLACACGSSEPGLTLSFQQHALDCNVPGLQAWLTASNLPGTICELTVTEDRTVTGSCNGVPTGESVNFRLLYYTVDEARGVDIQLASVLGNLDLTSPSDDVVVLDLTQAPISTNFDSDNDGMTNIEEFCMGRDPLNREG